VDPRGTCASDRLGGQCNDDPLDKIGSSGGGGGDQNGDTVTNGGSSNSGSGYGGSSINGSASADSIRNAALIAAQVAAQAAADAAARQIAQASAAARTAAFMAGGLATTVFSSGGASVSKNPVDPPSDHEIFWRYDAVLSYMTQQMNTNMRSPRVGQWQSPAQCIGLSMAIPFFGDLLLGECQAGVASADKEVLTEWYNMVHGGADWDQKQEILDMLGPGTTGWMAMRGGPQPSSINFDVWSNIHYGYVGMAHGIPAEILQAGQQFAAWIWSTPEDADNYEVDLGIELYRAHPSGVSKGDVQDLLVRHWARLKDYGMVRLGNGGQTYP
jgi:hypothetical protein